MYSKRSGLILGFHGCDKKLRDEVVSKRGVVLNSSSNKHDWLGHGAYFWENNQERALEFAKDLKDNPRAGAKNIVNEPAVLGAVIDLGYCLDLIDSQYLKVLSKSYNFLCETHSKYGKKIPRNIIPAGKDFLVRNLDCAVIEATHKLNGMLDRKSYDSVRGVFWEGEELYRDAGFKEKNHIQIALRNPNCIKGYFIPRELDNKYTKLGS